ncbi:MAG: energy transducer TonB [Chitinophagaceae bacterium]
MDTNKILSADFLDLLFDNRNKDYGAYELRRTYQNRIARSLIFTGIFVGLTFTGVVLANKLEPKEKSMFAIRDLTIEDIKPDVKEPEPIPEPPRKIEPIQVQTERLTQFDIVEDKDVEEPPPTQDDLANAKIDVIQTDGAIDEGIVAAQNIDEGKGVIEEKTIKQPDEPFTSVEIDAKFDGNWEKFLLRNLNPQTPVDNNAPAGNYTVIMQFVVDIDGTVSDIKALSNLGYGLEQEAIRVLKKATKWKPAIQNGRKVKAYRKQSITFQVTEE